ncbi:hypothetical protein Fmac_024592 [Flemingia macrophylla]|uniref:HMA domain-containing protein n=1 Tax=Flemingia macrophylla TaxID=520843 RepID=A0ABD1LPV4_9FABA
MAPTETKAEQPKEAEEEHAQVSEPLPCKNVVLRVSIHCQGCLRKVKKILQALEGVLNVDIDLRQQKVVVTGNVNSETLIKKLTKAGKHAELWPQKPDSRKKKKQTDPESSNNEEAKINQQNDKEQVQAAEATARDDNNNAKSKNNEASSGGDSNVNKTSEGCATTGGSVQFQEPTKHEVRHAVIVPPAAPVTEKKVSIAVQVPNDNEATENDNKTGAAGAGKKKKKKVMTDKAGSQEGATATVINHHSDATAKGDSGNQSQGVPNPRAQVQFLRPANESPPRRHQTYAPPPHYYAPPPPPVVHTVSYHTARPSSSYGAAYYASPPPYSYANVMRPGNEMEPPPPYVYEPEPYNYTWSSSQASNNSFELFSDENPNACSVM